MDQLHVGRYRAEQQANGVRETNGPPADVPGQKENTASSGVERYSLCGFEDGTRYVDVQMDAHTFDGMSVAEMNRTAKQILMQKFAGKVIGIDNQVFVNGDSVNEYLHPSKAISSDIRKAKLTASGELDNLLDAGKPLPNKPDGMDGHIHPEVTDFSYLQTIFKVGKEYFEGIVNIKNIKRGRLLKDVTKIRNITEDIVSSYGTSPKSNFLRDASMISIRQENQNVKEESAESEYLTDEQFQERYGLKLRAVDELENGANSQALGDMRGKTGQQADVSGQKENPAGNRSERYSLDESHGNQTRLGRMRQKWKPNLDSTEWGIVNCIVDHNQGTEITSTCNMFYKMSKGRTVFGVYSTEDSTLLYASRGQTAEKEQAFVGLLREEHKNGNVIDSSTEGLRAWSKTVRMQRATNDNYGAGNVASGRSAGNVGLHGRSSGLYASTALRNLLDNIFQEGTAGRRGDGRVSDDEQFRERYGLKLRAVDDLENAANSQAREETQNQGRRPEKFSVDDFDSTDFAAVQAAMNAQSKEWNEMYLRNQLGDDGYEKYRAWEKEQQTQKKQESKERAKQRNAEKQAARKSATKPVAESKPIEAKKEQRVHKYSN